MNIAEINFTRLISGFSGSLPFNSRSKFTQLHEIVTSHKQLCSELLLCQAGFISYSPVVYQFLIHDIGKKKVLHGHIKFKHDSDTDAIVALKQLHCFYFHTP